MKKEPHIDMLGSFLMLDLAGSSTVYTYITWC